MPFAQACAFWAQHAVDSANDPQKQQRTELLVPSAATAKINREPGTVNQEEEQKKADPKAPVPEGVSRTRIHKWRDASPSPTRQKLRTRPLYCFLSKHT